MLKSKDFYLKTIYDNKGKKLGVVEDICLDFYNGRITGFKSSSSGILSKNSYIDIKDVIHIGEDIIVYKTSAEITGLELKSIKNMNVINTNGLIKGVFEDIIIEEYSYDIKGISISSGIIDRFIRGKQILLLNECILGEEYILYIGKDNILFKIMPHNMEKISEH
ncbi:MAG: PRC-barrel domain-containing protein [Clostridium sp.]